MVKRCLLAVCLVFSFGITSIAHGEVVLDLNFIMRHNPIDSVPGERELSSFASGQTNELKIALMGLIRGYQLFISTQDMPVCNFTPSCSRFGMASFKKYGIFYGLLMTSDRLQRCHGMGRRYYSIHPETGKSDDPIEHNFLWNR